MASRDKREKLSKLGQRAYRLSNKEIDALLIFQVTYKCSEGEALRRCAVIGLRQLGVYRYPYADHWEVKPARGDTVRLANAVAETISGLADEGCFASASDFMRYVLRTAFKHLGIFPTMQALVANNWGYRQLYGTKALADLRNKKFSESEIEELDSFHFIARPNKEMLEAAVAGLLSASSSLSSLIASKLALYLAFGPP